MNSGNLDFWLDYIWIPLMTALAGLWIKFTGLSTRTQLLEKAETHQYQLRKEDTMRRDRERAEVMARIDSHHKIIMTKLDNLESRIKNVH